MNNIYQDRRIKIHEKLIKNSILILFSGEEIKKSADANFKFYTNNNFHYLTGICRENAIYMCENSNNIIKETIFIKKRNENLEKWLGKFLTIEEAQEISAINEIKYYENFDNDLIKLLSSNKHESIYFDLENSSFNDNLSISQRYAKTLTVRYPFLNIKNINLDLSELRRLKDSFEIEKIKDAISISNEALLHMIKNMKIGMKEHQIEAYFNFILNLNGANPSFETIAASGENGVILHYVKNDRVVENDDLILCDLGAEKNKYCSDITRTYPVSGKFNNRQRAVYNVVLDANKTAIKACKPGVTINELNETTKKVLFNGLIELGIISNEDELSKYYFHGVSHYLGLDVHDVGDREKPLEPGCVITIEPGLYIEEEKLGIRIEDDILITNEGCMVLTEAIVKEVDEIEKLMNEAV